MNHSVSLHVQLICFYTFCLILFLLRAFTNIYIIYVYICGSSEKLRCKFSLIVLLFLFLLMDTIFNHYIKYPAVKQTRKAPQGSFPSSSAAAPRIGCRFQTDHPAFVSFLSSLSSRKKVDPNDFSPRIKQETIITVEFMFFQRERKSCCYVYVQNWFICHMNRITSLVLVLSSLYSVV